MAKPDLVFLTKTNGEKVMQATKQQLPRCEVCGEFVAGPHDCPGQPKENVFDSEMIEPPALKE